MEIRLKHHINSIWRNRITLVLFCLFIGNSDSISQPPLKSYTVRDGKMIIALSKQLSEASLDSFIAQYDLYDLPLKDVMRGKNIDSLKKLGWSLDVNKPLFFGISKPLMSYNEIANPADKIIFTERHAAFADMFPRVSSRVTIGYNRFKNKNDFAIKDSTVTFFLRNNLKAGKVRLGGSFNDWSPDNLAMQRTDSGWIAQVKLGVGKYWYKFIVDGNWTIDNDNNLWENDGLGNNNSVYYKTNMIFRLPGYANAKRVFLAGSFNDWKERELAFKKTSSGWELPLYLADGTHTYRFIVDGNWITDPTNKNTLPNEYKNFNSVIYLGKPYVFHLDGYPQANQVVLSGSFNKWRSDELYMKKTASGWDLSYALGPGNYEYEFIVDGKYISKSNNPNASGHLFFVIRPNHTFRLKGYPNAKNVSIAGDFNNWAPNSFQLSKAGDEWEITVHLSPGKHLYKFLVDGKWIIDPGNKDWEQNEFNTGNSVYWMEANQ